MQHRPLAFGVDPARAALYTVRMKTDATQLEELEAAASTERMEAEAAPQLGIYQHQLPAGDHGSINLGWWRNGAALERDPGVWLDQGFRGIRFQGAGIDRTHLRCTSWDGITVAVKRHNGVVELRDMTIHCGYDRAFAFGEQNLARTISPDFMLRLVNCRIVADTPETYGGRRPKWLVFAYQADVLMVDCELDGYEAVEHDHYGHGAARYGWMMLRVKFKRAGAECFKVRSDASETAWAGPDVRVILRDCEFRDWYQAHSWRGGAGVVLQGAAAHVMAERCSFHPGGAIPGADIPAHQRSKCFMVSSEGLSYDIDTGQVGTGFGNGHVFVRNCAMDGGPGPSWYSSIMRAGRNGGGQLAAKSLTVKDCGIWGDHMSLQVSEVPTWRVQGCNTEPLRAYCRNQLGMRAEHEASMFTSQGAVPVSVGR